MADIGMSALAECRQISKSGTETWKFSELLADPKVRDRWEKVRKFFFLRESTYDVTTRCNIRCEGCYYYEGEKQFVTPNENPGAWKQLLAEEKKRGITYVVLAGASHLLFRRFLRLATVKSRWDASPLTVIGGFRTRSATRSTFRFGETIKPVSKLGRQRISCRDRWTITGKM